MSSVSNIFFSPFPDADRDFHNKNFYVLPRNLAVLGKVCELGDDDRVCSLKFHLSWSRDFFKTSTSSYSQEFSKLDAKDLVSLELLWKRMSMFPREPLINTKGLVPARDGDGL